MPPVLRKLCPSLAGMMAALAVLSSAPAQAAECFLYSGTSTPAARLIVLSADSEVATTFCDGEAGYTSDVYLSSPEWVYLGTGHSTAYGSEVDVGAYVEGTELVFAITVRDTGYTYYSGPGSRNPDGQVHAAIADNGDGTFEVGFEDLFGGGDRDYNDINLVVVATAVLVEDDATDTDCDGVDDYDDNCIWDANPDQSDGDGDGLGDACDVCDGSSNSDSDGDGTCDENDLCPADADNDGDGDGSCGDADACPYDPFNDEDGDGVCGDTDTCPLDADNDADGDGVCGDVDVCPWDAEDDADGDGLCGDVDDCAYDADNDADGDGVCGDVDVCPWDAEDDADGDGLCGDVDDCAYDADNDADGDGVCGDVDVCPWDAEDDADADGFCADADNCPDDENTDQSDSDGDGAGDACDVCVFDAEDDEDGDGVCGDVDACASTVLPDTVTDRLLPNHYADLDGDGVFDSGSPSKFSFTLDDTGGCSCHQIIEELGLSATFTRWGCPVGQMNRWVKHIGGS